MKRTRYLIAALLAAMAAVPASADAYEWNIAQAGSYPGGLRCVSTTGSRVCFEGEGDKIWVKDTKRDHYSALAKWRVPLERREGYCRNRLTAGYWGYCNKDFSEWASFHFWAARYDRDTNRFLGPWSKGGSDRVANP